MPAQGTGIPVALAFGAGLLAAVNPCGFAMLPAFISYYLGSRLGARSATGRAAEGLAVGLVLTAGFMVVFGAVGGVFALGARAVVRIVPWATIVVGAGLVVLGGWLVAGRHLALPIPGLRSRAARGSGYRSIFAFGMAYAVGSLSCTLPVFLVVIGGGLAAGSALGTLAVFLAYGLGMSTILMLLSLATGGLRELLVRKIRRLLPSVSRASGVLLILGWGYVVYYWASILRGAEGSPPIRFVQALQRRAQDLVMLPGERGWFVVGAALFVVALVVLSRGRRPLPAQERVAAEELASEKEAP